MRNMNMIYLTHRDALTGSVTHTRITYLKPAPSWRDWTDAIGAALATGAAGAVIYAIVWVFFGG